MKVNLNKSLTNQSTSSTIKSFNNVDWSIVEKIIKSSKEKFEKEKAFNVEGELNLMRILASYSNILDQNVSRQMQELIFKISLQQDINPNQDTDYYNFFLAVSKYMQANGLKDWMEGSAIILQNSKTINTSFSYDQKSHIYDSKNPLLGQQINSRGQLSKQYQGDNSFSDKMNHDDTYNQNESNTFLYNNQRRSFDGMQMADNNFNIQNRMNKQINTQKGHLNKSGVMGQPNETISREDRKKQRTNAKRSLIQTINNNLESIENKLVDIEESQNHITRMNMSDLDLSNISHSNMNNTTLVSCHNLNHFNSLKYVNQTKNELKTQLGFDNSFLDQALNQTTQDQTNTSHWQHNTQYISIKEQEQEDEEDEEIFKKQNNNDTEVQITNKIDDDNENEYEQLNQERRRVEVLQKDHYQNNTSNQFHNTSYDNEYTIIPQQDTSISYEKLFSNQTLQTTPGIPTNSFNSKFSKNIYSQGDGYLNKSIANQINNSSSTGVDSSHLGISQAGGPHLKQKLIQQNFQGSFFQNNSNSNTSSKINLSSHLDKFSKLNNSMNTSLTNLNKSNPQNRLTQTTTDLIDYVKNNCKDQFQNSTLKGTSSVISFNPQKSQLLASFEKQFSQFNRRPSHESDLSHTLGKSELNQYSMNQPILLQSKQKHNVSFGENSIVSLDENEQNFKLKSQSFIRWVQYVNNRRQLRWEKEEQIRKLILALDYYQSMTQQKVLVLLKGYNMLMKERRRKENVIIQKSQKNIKQKYLQLYLLNVQISQLNAKQEQKAIKFSIINTKRRYLNLLRQYKNLQKLKKQSNPKRQVFNRIFIEFILMLVLEKTTMDAYDKKEFWLRIKSFQSEKACNILQKYQKQSHITEKGIEDLLKPHLEWLRLDAKQRIFQSFVDYKKFMEDTQQFRSCRIKFYIFQTWKNRFIKKREQEAVIQQHFNFKYTKFLEKVIQSWKDIASKNTLIKQRYKYLKIQSKFNLLEKYFARWYDKYDYYIQNKEEIIKGSQFNGYLTTKRGFQALIEFVKLSKQKKEYYQFAFTHYSIVLSKKVFRAYEIYRERKENYYKVVNSVEDYASSNSLKKFFKSWKKYTIQEKMVNNAIRQRLYTKVFQALQIYQNRMLTLNNSVDDLIEKKQISFLKKGFQGLINNYLLSQEAIQQAFTHYYLKKMNKSFQELLKYKVRKQRKYVNLVEYQRNKQQQFQQNVFIEWKIRSQVKQRRRITNKIAVNNFIHNLFKKMIQILRINVQRNQIKEQVKQYINQQNKKRIFMNWRESYIIKKCQTHYSKKLLSSIISSWKQFIEEKRENLIKRREANLLYQAKLMKIAKLFIGCLQMNRDKSVYKSEALFRVNQIHQQKIKRNCFLALKNVIQKRKLNQQKFANIFNNHIKLKLKNIMDHWSSMVSRNGQKYLAVTKILEINRISRIKQSFEVWQHYIKHMQYEDALNQKSLSLRDYLLVKRFYRAIKKRSIERKNESEMNKAAEYFYKRFTFYRFVNGFYNSIEEKKQKQIAVRHYADKIQHQSFYFWKKFTQEKYERQFYKIMSSNKRDNLLDNSINNYVSEDQQQQLQQQNFYGTNELALNSLNTNNNSNSCNQSQQLHFNNLISNNNSTLFNNKDSNFNISNNPSNIFKNSATKKSVSFQKTLQDDLLTNNLNYTGVQEDLSKYQSDGTDEYQSN